ncbi:MAG: hypothetical protein IIU03_06880 [Bacteroidales bacterium]|nr:hypothetical protein [Bacteroidales bacterium]MBQ5539943.1 hypothetical protein [Bacteroidales bacterium]MBR4678706.1 hypothetical protein [Bacteroidales bacterium]MEE3447285.1 hypothetical protein [Bacteroidales bacterium]
MFRNKLFNFLTKYFDALESLFIVFLAVSLFLMVKEVRYSYYCVYAGLGLLAFLYWLMAIRPFEKQVAGIRIAIRRVVYVAYLLGCLSMLAVLRFDYEVDPVPLVIATLVFLALAVILLLIKKYKMKEPKKVTANIIRCIIFAVILIWLKFIMVI